MAGDIAITVEDGIATLTLDDPASGNALSEAMVTAITGACEACGRDPAVRVLLMSGYPDRVVPAGVATDPRFEFLSKPFQPSTLARRVRECLDRAAPNAEL